MDKFHVLVSEHHFRWGHDVAFSWDYAALCLGILADVVVIHCLALVVDLVGIVVCCVPTCVVC